MSAILPSVIFKFTRTHFSRKFTNRDQQIIILNCKLKQQIYKCIFRIGTADQGPLDLTSGKKISLKKDQWFFLPMFKSILMLTI